MERTSTTRDCLLWGVEGGAVTAALTLTVSRLANVRLSWVQAAMIGIAGGTAGFFMSSGGRLIFALRQIRHETQNIAPPLPPTQPFKNRPSLPRAHPLHHYYVNYKAAAHNADLSIETVRTRIAGQLVQYHLHHSCRGLKRMRANTETILLDLRGPLSLTQALEQTDKPIVVVGQEEFQITAEQLANPNLYLPEVKKLNITCGELDFIRIVAKCPSLESITGVTLTPEAQSVLAQHFPYMELDARQDQRTIFLNELDPTLLQNWPQLETIVMPDAKWAEVGDALDLRGLSSQICEEILLQKPSLHQLTLDTVSATDLLRWQSWGLLDRLQKIDLRGCDSLDSNVFTPLSLLPSIAIIDLPNRLPRGSWLLPELTDLILIRELYAKYADSWGDAHITCCPFWASVPNAHGANLPSQPFGPSLASLEQARETIPLALDGDAFLEGTPVQQEHTVWKLQSQECNKARFRKLWPLVNQEQYTENFPIRALRLSLRLWAEAHWPEWVLDDTLCPEIPERFDPRDAIYCDFQANIARGLPCHIHKQVIAAIGPGWARDTLHIPNQTQNETQIDGLLGVSMLAFTTMSVAQDDIEYRSGIDNPEAFRWIFELAYNARAIETIPAELLDQVISLAFEYQYPNELLQNLWAQIGDRWLSQLPPITPEDTAMTSIQDCKRLARAYAGAADQRNEYQKSLQILLTKLCQNDPSFVATVVIGRHPNSKACAIGLQAFRDAAPQVLGNLTPAAHACLLTQVVPLSAKDVLRIRVLSYQPND